MSNCISREKLLLALKKWQNTLIEDYGKNDEYVKCLESVLTGIEKAPAADVWPVVLCRDCLHYEMGACLKIYDDGAANKDAWQERKPEDFCSYSEKREES